MSSPSRRILLGRGFAKREGGVDEGSCDPRERRPEVLRYEEVPDPQCPDGCGVIDAEAISIEGGELLARAAGDLQAVPHIVGYLSAGTVS
jgi:hypothetical protein